MRNTDWRINFGVGLLGASNLVEENMLPTRVISGEMRAGFTGRDKGERGPRKKKEKA